MLPFFTGGIRGNSYRLTTLTITRWSTITQYIPALPECNSTIAHTPFLIAHTPFTLHFCKEGLKAKFKLLGGLRGWTLPVFLSFVFALFGIRSISYLYSNWSLQTTCFARFVPATCSIKTYYINISILLYILIIIMMRLFASQLRKEYADNHR